jgi:GAF domain-containing protein
MTTDHGVSPSQRPSDTGRRTLGTERRGNPGAPTTSAQGDPVRDETPMTRESVLARTLVELADTLVDDFDVVDLLMMLADRCVEVLDVQAAGIMLATPDGELRVMASSSEAMRVLELFEIQAQEGPCFDCYHSGHAVVNQDLDARNGRWPRFSTEALGAGFRSAHALPMRLRGSVIGALNLFRSGVGEMEPADVKLAQAFADVATIAILQHRAATEAKTLAQQLTHALNSRIMLEQAKGMIAERLNLDMEQSFATLRNHARNHNLRLGDVARSVIDNSISVSGLDAPR